MRTRLLSVTAASLALAAGAAVWTLAPAKAHADAPKVEQPAPADPWAKGPVDRGNMVQGVLDDRSASGNH